MKPYVVNNSGHRAHPCVYTLMTGLPFFSESPKEGLKNVTDISGTKKTG